MLCFGHRARREEAAPLAPLVYKSSEGRGAQPSLAKRTKLSAQTSPRASFAPPLPLDVWKVGMEEPLHRLPPGYPDEDAFVFVNMAWTLL